MKRLVHTLVALVLTALPARLAAQDTEWNRYTLEALGGVFVRAEAAPACEEAGVTSESVRLQAEGALARSEVEQLTEGEMLRNPALPELRITIECAPGDGVADALAYSVSVRVLQSVQMTRDSQITLSEAVTWYASAVGARPSGEAPAAIEEALAGSLEQFAAAYVTANEEESQPSGPAAR